VVSHSFIFSLLPWELHLSSSSFPSNIKSFHGICTRGSVIHPECSRRVQKTHCNSPPSTHPEFIFQHWFSSYTWVPFMDSIFRNSPTH
jgi:hypothetical protein